MRINYKYKEEILRNITSKKNNQKINIVL